MSISAPCGSDELVPFDTAHRVLVPSGTTPSCCRSINALALSVGEFVAAARDYPIVFATGDAGKSFAPVIVLGLGAGTNLFLDESGEWDRNAYFPAYVRRFPFCLSKERIVCIVRSYADASGMPLYDGRGNATPRWQAAQALLAGAEDGLERSAEHCAGAAKREALERFSGEETGGPQLADARHVRDR